MQKYTFWDTVSVSETDDVKVTKSIYCTAYDAVPLDDLFDSVLCSCSYNDHVHALC